jgi:hypothetical protein
VTPSPFCTTPSATDLTQCTTCNANYWVNGTGLCTAPSVIDTNCLTCTNAGVCLTCSGTMIPQVNGLSCVTPPTNCATLVATDNTQCSICASGYHLVGTTCSACSTIDANCNACTNAGLCTGCALTFFPAANQLSCLPQATNCATLNVNPAICDVCNAGYYWSGTACVVCSTITNCLTCTSAGVCQSCSGTLVP